MQVDEMRGVDSLTMRAMKHAKEHGWIAAGDLIVLVHSLHDAVAGTTNVVNVIEARLDGVVSPTSARFNRSPRAPV